MDRLAHILDREGVNKLHDNLKNNKYFYHNNELKSENMFYKIINISCDHYKVNVNDVINSSTRKRQVVMAKYLAMYIIHQDFPYLQDTHIAKLFNCHRTTTLYALKTLPNLMDVDKTTQENYKSLRKKINILYTKPNKK
tara:strand:- start:160 stop:576 length:417 start_codon:yes stop_codon:yes gene_type:complete